MQRSIGCAIKAFLLGLFQALTSQVLAAGFGTLSGSVVGPDREAVAHAQVELRSTSSPFSLQSLTDGSGRFTFASVPLGTYALTVSQPGYAMQRQVITVLSGAVPVASFRLSESLQPIVVAASRVQVPASMTPTTLVDATQIERTPGAGLTNSQAMITDFVPGANFVHDMLHIRGGHQTSWYIEGVELPNTNIASNLGPQLDPRDIDDLAVERGSYGADFGDRTYGIFNIVPKTGFGLQNQGEAIVTAGSYGQTDEYASVGSHTGPLAYYASVDGNRSDLGLQTPGAQILHDTEDGYGAFGTLDYDLDSSNQLRVVSAARHDDYQVPNLPDQTLDDVQRESDGFVLGSWLHEFSAALVLQSSLFFHYNSADYDGSPDDFPSSTTDQRASSYGGIQESLRAHSNRNDLSVGVYAFGQRDHQYFDLLATDASSAPITQSLNLSGQLVALWLQDEWRLSDAVHVTGGVRQTFFSGLVHEQASSPRLGLTWQLPRLNWVLRGFWGRFYQAPPLATLSGPLLDYASSNALAYEPLHGERDTEYQYGLTLPLRGWSIDADHFRTAATNFFDHNPIGDSDIFFPVTITGALIRGYELAVRSPALWGVGRLHLAYSNQVAQGYGAISGGLQDFSPPSGYFALDHDQRTTLSTGLDLSLPQRLFASVEFSYGSGFSNGDAGPSHLPSHYAVDLTVGRDFGQHLSASLTALNLTDQHLLIDNSLTFGGLHYNNPLEVYAELHYRFKY